MRKRLLRGIALLALLAALLTGSVLAAEDGATVYVMDFAGILSENEVQTLEMAAADISTRYGCGVYIATLSDMADYGYYDIEVCSEAFYKELDLGLGADHNGILLILSMADRDYDLCAYGDAAHTAFTDYGKTTISDEFLDNFRDRDWYGGFFDYLSQSEYLLGRAEAGEPVDIGSRPRSSGEIALGILFSVILGLGISFLICAAIRGKMKSVRTAADADAYVPSGGVQFSIRQDQFIRTTQTRVYDPPTQRSSGGGGGGGTSVNSGGFSHSSGKF